MKKDIEFEKVKHVSIAITKSTNLEGGVEWQVYVVNYNDFPIDTVLISSRGYGTIDGEEKKTSTLRHMIHQIGGCEFELVEPIDPTVFGLTNEFWVSYYIDGVIRDKKFVFLPDSIRDEHLQLIPWINKQGVLHD
jgi:hypothetical protein